MVVGDSTFLAAERFSRMQTSLDAASGNFDQVVAVSQRMMNVALKNIHDKNKDVMSIFDGRNAYGSISADLGPSEIRIPTDIAESFSVSWLWNFTGGTFKANHPSGDVLTYDVTGWSVAVRVPLVSEDLADKTTDEESVRQWKKERRDWIKNNFNVAGDYRPEQLYAKMSSARFADIRFDRSSFRVDGKTLDWETWKRVPGNAGIASAFQMIMAQVCFDREKAGLTSAGFNFKMDPSRPLDPMRATYPPKQLQHQSYPYKVPESSGMKASAWNNGIESLEEDPGPYNCLLYCELVDDRPFSGAQIPHIGNFTTVGGPVGTPKAIDGTFALSHQLFFERFLLPNLQVFVQQSQIYPKPPGFQNVGKIIRSDLGYIMGANPDKDPTNDPKKSIYKFERKSATADTPLPFYEANVEVVRDEALFSSPARGEWTKFYATGSPKVTVWWEAFGKTIFIRGETHYWSHGTTASHSNEDKEKHQLAPSNSWWHGHYQMMWKMQIDLHPDSGSLGMTLSHAPDFVKVVVHPEDSSDWIWDEVDGPKKIQASIQASMEKQLDFLRDTLKVAFTDQFKFIYPGNGQLKFGDTYFNNKGDLLAVIDYGDLPAGKVDVSRPRTVGEPPASGGQEIGCPGENNPPPKPKVPRLSWFSNAPLRASLKPAPADQDTRVEIQLTGTNISTEPVYFSSLNTVLEGHTDPTQALFNKLSFITAPAEANTGNVLVGVKMKPPPVETAPKVAPILTLSRNSSRSFTCKVAVSAATGPIVVPPNGSISITAKGVTGAAGVPISMSVREVWCDAAGIVSAGDEAGVRAPLIITLEK